MWTLSYPSLKLWPWAPSLSSGSFHRYGHGDGNQDSSSVCASLGCQKAKMRPKWKPSQASVFVSSFPASFFHQKKKKEALVVKSILRNQRTNAAWLRFIPDATSVNLAALCASVVEISQVESTRTLRNSRSCHLHCNPYRHRYLKFDFRLKTLKLYPYWSLQVVTVG